MTEKADCDRISQLPINATHYEVFNVEPSTVTDDIIKKRYRDLALQCHPDKNESLAVYGKIMEKINAAHEILLDPKKRREYDSQMKISAADSNSAFSNMSTADADEAANSGVAVSTGSVHSEKKDLDLPPSELDKRNIANYGNYKTVEEDDRISRILDQLKLAEETVHLNPDITYEEVIALFRSVDPLLTGWDKSNSKFLESYYGIVNAVIEYWLKRKRQLTDDEKIWIISKINALFHQLSRILQSHKDIFKQDDTYEIFKPILQRRQYKNLLENIGYARESHRQGGSRRKSAHKRNQRNKRRTQRKKSYRKHKKSMKSK